MHHKDGKSSLGGDKSPADFQILDDLHSPCRLSSVSNGAATVFKPVPRGERRNMRVLTDKEASLIFLEYEST